MEITRIEAKNWLAWKDLLLDVEQTVVLICGDNNSGKSAVRHAVEYAFSGKVVDRGIVKAKDHDKLRNINAPERADMFVSVTYDAGPEDARDSQTRTRKPGDGFANTEGYEWVQYCLHPLRFLDLTDAERAAMLATVYKPSEEIIKAAMAKHIKTIKPTIKNYVRTSGVDTLDIAAVREQVINYRRQVKTELKVLPKDMPRLSDYDLPDDYAENVAAEAQALKEHDEKIDERVKRERDAATTVARSNAITERIQMMGTKVADAKRKIKKGKPIPEYDPARHDMLSIAYELLKGAKACPVCKQTAAPTLKDKIEAEILQLDTIHQKHLEATQIESTNATAQQTADHLSTELAELVRQHTALPDIPKQEDDGPATFNVMEARDNVANYGRYRNVVDIFKMAEKQSKELDDLITECDTLDKALAEGGPVMTTINEAGEALPIDTNLLALWGVPDLKIFDSGAITAKGVNAAMLSDSEKYRVSGAIALALAEVSGVGFCWLDGFEILLPPQQNALMAALEASDSGIENVFIGVSRTDAPDPDKIPEWLQVFCVDEHNKA